jgi:hypothetical protein
MIFGEKSIKCDSDLNVEIKNSKLSANMDSIFSVLLQHGGVGLIRAVGVVNVDDKSYELNRILYFNYSKENVGGMYKFTIFEEKINGTDTTPSDLFNTYFLPEKPNVPFYISLKKLHKNALLINGLTHPYFVCKIN